MEEEIERRSRSHGTDQTSQQTTRTQPKTCSLMLFRLRFNFARQQVERFHHSKNPSLSMKLIFGTTHDRAWVLCRL
jgi:hypothetical protein